MDRYKLIVIVGVCVAAFWSWGQEGGNTPSRPRRFTEFTVATLPAASTTTGQTFIVTDAASGGSCSSGGGSNRSWCRSNGTSYDAVGDGGGAGGGVSSVSGTANQIASTGGTTPVLSITSPFIFPGEATFAAATTGAASFNLPCGTAPTTPAAGDVWCDSNIEKHVAQTSTNGGIVLYDSGGSNARTDDTTGTITPYTVHHPLAAPVLPSKEVTDSCPSAVCTETWNPDDTVLSVGSSGFTSASGTGFQAITGLSFTLPANRATNAKLDCDILYHQNTAAAVDSWGIQDVTVAPSNIYSTEFTQTAATTWADGNTATLTTTTATLIGATFTPSAITTNWHARLHIFIEQPSNASSSVFQIMSKQATAADTITVMRGSSCEVHYQ